MTAPTGRGFFTPNKDFSMHPADRAKGWGQEIDTSLWIPVGRYKIENGKKNLLQIHWIMPYIWVDHPMTIINGREIFGYPKYLGRFEMPTSPDNADYFSLDVNAFKTYSPDTEATWGRVLDVTRITKSAPAQIAQQWNCWADFAIAMFAGIILFGLGFSAQKTPIPQHRLQAHLP